MKSWQQQDSYCWCDHAMFRYNINSERARYHPGHCSNNIFKTTEFNMAAVVSILLIAWYVDI